MILKFCKLYKSCQSSLPVFLCLVTNKFFNEVFIFYFLQLQKCLKIHQLNIIAITKKDYKKKLTKNIKFFLKKKRKRCNNMVVKDIKHFQNMKSKSWLSKEKVEVFQSAIYFKEDYHNLDFLCIFRTVNSNNHV